MKTNRLDRMTMIDHPYFHDQHPVILDEESYKSIIADITKNNVPGSIVNNLPHKDWAPLIKFVRYVTYSGSTFKFFVPNKYNGWHTYIQFRKEQWLEQINDRSLNANEVARLMLWSGDILVHCPCPSFKFWGFQYIMTQLDSAIIPEKRYPHIRNPQLHGVCCKHLNRTLKVLPFYLGDIARAVSETRKVIDNTI